MNKSILKKQSFFNKQQVSACFALSYVDGYYVILKLKKLYILPLMKKDIYIYDVSEDDTYWRNFLPFTTNFHIYHTCTWYQRASARNHGSQRWFRYHEECMLRNSQEKHAHALFPTCVTNNRTSTYIYICKIVEVWLHNMLKTQYKKGINKFIW